MVVEEPQDHLEIDLPRHMDELARHVNTSHSDDADEAHHLDEDVHIYLKGEVGA